MFHDEDSTMEYVLTFKRIIPIIAFFRIKLGKCQIAGLLFLSICQRFDFNRRV